MPDQRPEDLLTARDIAEQYGMRLSTAEGLMRLRGKEGKVVRIPPLYPRRAWELSESRNPFAGFKDAIRRSNRTSPDSTHFAADMQPESAAYPAAPARRRASVVPLARARARGADA